MKVERTLKSAAADVADKMHNGTAETAAGIHNGVDAAEDRVDEAIDSFGDRLAALEAKWREHGEELLASAREIGSVAGKQVRAHPVAAFGVAFVAGMLAAKLLRRR